MMIDHGEGEGPLGVREIRIETPVGIILIQEEEGEQITIIRLIPGQEDDPECVAYWDSDHYPTGLKFQQRYKYSQQAQ